MCGRYTLAASGEALAEAFGLAPRADLRPRYNIAPGQPIAIVRPAAGGGCEWALPRWGLVPPWAKDPGIGSRLINARAETAAEKPSFRAAFRHRRCLVPADGFYEWARRGGKRYPHLFRLRDGRPFAIAGLWERWDGPQGPLETCALLTTEANRLVGAIHPRMPAILDAAEARQWLDPDRHGPETLRTLLHPRRAEQMTGFPVSTAVNRVANDDPQCVVPLTEVLDLVP